MSYLELLSDETKAEHFLAVLKPRRFVTSWELVSGSIYSSPFDYSEHVGIVEVDGVALDVSSDATLAAGEFYFDQVNKVLYVRTSDSADPGTKKVVATFELYFSTIDAHWHRDPLDEASLEVYFEPLMQSPAPQLKASTQNLAQGYLPVQSTALKLANAEHILERYLYDSSTKKCEVLVYHWLSENGNLSLDVDNIKLIMRGVCSNSKYSDGSIQIEILDRVDLLDTEWRNRLDSFYSTDIFPDVDPNFIGRPIRYVFGMVDGFKPVNVAFNDAEPTTSDNREHCVMSEGTGLDETVLTVVGASSTTTRTYLNTVKGLSVGDSIFMDGATDYYSEVLIIDRTLNFIEHAANAAPMAAGELVKKGFVSAITIVQNDIPYRLAYTRDYTCTDNLLGTGLAGFILNTSVETTLSMPNTIQPSDTIFCRVYGRTNNVTKAASPFGADDSALGNLADPAVILWEILKTKTGLTEADLDAASFTALQALVGDKAVGFAIPRTSNNDFPKIRALVIDFMQTLLAKIFLTDDLTWAVVKTDALGATDYLLQDDEILGFDAEFDYSDLISDTFIEYAFQELSEDDREKSLLASAHSDVCELLHKVKAQKTFSSLFVFEEDAQDLADLISYLFGDRLGTYDIQTISRLFPATLGSVVEVSRTKLPGFAYDGETEVSRKFAVLGATKGLRKVALSLTDQKGIEENL